MEMMGTPWGPHRDTFPPMGTADVTGPYGDAVVTPYPSAMGPTGPHVCPPAPLPTLPPISMGVPMAINPLGA